MPDTASQKRDRRQAVLDAALELFTERGFDGTAVPEIAKRARVGTGTVYRYFESKEAIVNTLYRAHKRALMTSILDRLDPALPARERLRIYWQGMATFAHDHPQAFRFPELHHHSPYLDADSLALEQQAIAIARATFEHLRELQIVKDVPAGVVMAIVHGSFVGMIKARDGGYLDLTPEAVDVAEQCVWEAVRR